MHLMNNLEQGALVELSVYIVLLAMRSLLGNQTTVRGGPPKRGCAFQYPSFEQDQILLRDGIYWT